MTKEPVARQDERTSRFAKQIMKPRRNKSPKALSAISARPGREIVSVERLRSIRIETLGEVAAVLNHESRNLLGALKTCLQVLRRNPHLNSDDAELLDIV